MKHSYGWQKSWMLSEITGFRPWNCKCEHCLTVQDTLVPSCFSVIFLLFNWTVLPGLKMRGTLDIFCVYSQQNPSKNSHQHEPPRSSVWRFVYVCFPWFICGWPTEQQFYRGAVYLRMLLKPQPSWPVIMSALGDIPARRDPCCGQSGSNLNPVHCKHSRRAQDICLSECLLPYATNLKLA